MQRQCRLEVFERLSGAFLRFLQKMGLAGVAAEIIRATELPHPAEHATQPRRRLACKQLLAKPFGILEEKHHEHEKGLSHLVISDSRSPFDELRLRGIDLAHMLFFATLGSVPVIARNGRQQGEFGTARPLLLKRRQARYHVGPWCFRPVHRRK